MKDQLGEQVAAKQNSVFVPFLLGGLVGAAIGLLLAPKSGSETRKQIKDLAEDTKDKIASTIDRGKLAYDDTKVAISSAVEAGKQAYAQERDKVLTGH